MMRRVTLFLMVLVLAFPGMVQAEKVRLKRTEMKIYPIQEWADSKRGSFWTLNRKTYSLRGQTRLDGLVVFPEGSPYKVKSVKRQDGEHKILLGAEGSAPHPGGELGGHLFAVERERMRPYLLSSKRSDLLALFYLPHGAQARAKSRKDGILVKVVIPSEQKRRSKKKSGPAGSPTF